MKLSVVLYNRLPEDLRLQLVELFDVTEINDLTPETLEQHADAFQKAAGILGFGGKIDAAFLEKAPELRAASSVSVGVDNFDIAALTARGVVLMHTPTVLTETVADAMMALVLTSARRIINVVERVKNGEWQGSIDADWFGVDVHHKKMGILGMGRIGLALAQRANAGFGMPILYNARKHHQEAERRFDAQYCSLDRLLEESDFLCISLPLTEQTHHLIGREQLAKMKPTAVLINAGRGPVVDEEALITALKEGRIHAAGLDVFETEPLSSDSPLLKMPNVVTLPHIGSATHETRYDMAKDAVENLIAALTGKPEKNCVNPEVLK